MDKDLTVSQLDRQNILNNDLAIAEIQKQTRIQGIYFEDKLCFTKSMVATYFEVELRTVERYVSENQEEISGNGYEVLKGKISSLISSIKRLVALLNTSTKGIAIL